MPALLRRLSPVLAAFILLCGSASASRAPVILNIQVSHDSYLAHSEPAVAENPRNPQNLIAGSKFFTDPERYQFKIGTMYSMNGGRTWHDTGVLPGYGNFATISDISLAFGPDGTAYAVVLGCNAGICPGTTYRSGVFLSRSTNGGRTWSNPVTVFEDDSGTTFSDKPWVAVDTSRGPGRGTVYVAWNLDPIPDSCGGTDAVVHAGAPGGIVVAKSTDGARSFGRPVNVFPFDGQQEAIGAIPAVGPDGRVSVVFTAISCAGGAMTGIDVTTSRDRGTTFAPAHTISAITPVPAHLGTSTFRVTTLPAFTVSPRDGAMVAAWADMRNGDADILASRSVDGGSTWTTPTRVNHDHPGNGRDQFMPALATSPNGTVTCAWFDRRLDPANRRIDEYVAQSRNRGLSFGHNLRVTDHSWDPGIDAPLPEGRTTNTFIGDYQALAVDNLVIHPLWNDTQDGKSQQIRTAAIPLRTFARWLR